MLPCLALPCDHVSSTRRTRRLFFCVGLKKRARNTNLGNNNNHHPRLDGRR